MADEPRRVAGAVPVGRVADGREGATRPAGCHPPMSRVCPTVSDSVLPRGGHGTPEIKPFEWCVPANLRRVLGVLPPTRPIAQGAGVCTCAPRTIVASEGRTPRTRKRNGRKYPIETILRHRAVPPRGRTQMDTVDSGGEP